MGLAKSGFVVTQMLHRIAALTWLCAIATPAPATASNRHDAQARTPPPSSAPESVIAVPGNATVTITWSPVPGADGYRIYRGSKGEWDSTPVARTVRTSHTGHGLVNGTTYSFTVAAYTKGGDGPLSLAVSAMPMAPPQDVTATAGNRRITLNWQPSAGATSYDIYRKAGSEPDFIELSTGVMTTSFVDPRVTNGVRHHYHVAAVTAAAASDWSAEVSAIPMPPTVAPGGESLRSNEVSAMAARSDGPLSSFDFCEAGSTRKAHGRAQRLWRKVWRF